MHPFALAMISIADGPPFAAMVIDELALPLAAIEDVAGLAAEFTQSIHALLDRWDEVLPRLHVARTAWDAAESADALRAQALPCATVRFHPPVDRPRQLFCTGANYRQHVIGLMLGDPDMRGLGNEHIEDPAILRQRAEVFMDERAADGVPYVFLRSPETLVGANDEVFLPRHFTKPDWELELAVVIGRTAADVTEDDVMAHVAGYTILNDLTARERVFRKDMPSMGADWLAGKNWRGSAPCGPYLVPSCFVADPYALRIELALNNRPMQDETTADMVIPIARQLSYLSGILTLHPGDILATGSPAGNGSHHGVFMAPGDVLTGSITGLGRQRTQCV